MGLYDKFNLLFSSRTKVNGALPPNLLPSVILTAGAITIFYKITIFISPTFAANFLESDQPVH